MTPVVIARRWRSWVFALALASVKGKVGLVDA